MTLENEPNSAYKTIAANSTEHNDIEQNPENNNFVNTFDKFISLTAASQNKLQENCNNRKYLNFWLPKTKNSSAKNLFH